MKKYFNFIKDNPLFNGMEETEINAILQCSGAFSKKYQKNDIIIHTEDEIKNIGLILNGKIEIIREDLKISKEKLQKEIDEIEEGYFYHIYNSFYI